MLSLICIYLLGFAQTWLSVPPCVRALQPILPGRIVGGSDTSIELFPFHISLKYFDSHRCGGAIIRVNVVLTAAHCVSSMLPKHFKVVAGTSKREIGGDSADVKGIIVHEGFDPFYYLDDLALLILETGFCYGSHIQAISLASQNEILPAGTKASVTGFGTIYESGPQSDILQLVHVSIVSIADCKKAYATQNNVTEAMLCAGEPFGGLDACQGDSGGPLIVGSKVYGVVSWGVGCARRGYPGVYANVGNLRNWIDVKLKFHLK